MIGDMEPNQPNYSSSQLIPTSSSESLANNDMVQSFYYEASKSGAEDFEKQWLYDDEKISDLTAVSTQPDLMSSMDASFSSFSPTSTSTNHQMTCDHLSSLSFSSFYLPSNSVDWNESPSTCLTANDVYGASFPTELRPNQVESAQANDKRVTEVLRLAIEETEGLSAILESEVGFERLDGLEERAVVNSSMMQLPLDSDL